MLFFGFRYTADGAAGLRRYAAPSAYFCCGALIPKLALPKVVSDAIEKRYPKSTLKEIMEETEIKARKKGNKGKKEKLSAYEVVLDTTDKKEVEVRVSPKGKILEDSGAPKKKPKNKK